MELKILGLNGSGRRGGNSELLLQKALQGAEAEGAETEQVDLARLEIKPCKGCLACIFRDKGCLIKDDMSALLEKLLACDGLILAAPTYLLAPAGVVKMVLDRSLAVFKRAGELKQDRYAATINVAGLDSWNSMGQDLLSLFILFFQFKPSGFLKAFGPGPGEVLLDPDNLERSEVLGSGVARRECVEPYTADDTCPVCRSSSYNISGGTINCAVCGIRASLINSKPVRLYFNPYLVGNHRWTPENMERHYQEWILGSKDRYLDLREKIELLKAGYFQ